MEVCADGCLGKGLTWLCIAGMVLGVAVVVGKMVILPLGTADAITNWNLKARYIFLGKTRWLNMFSPLLPRWILVDYPLLVPLTVARSWAYIGRVAVVGSILQHATIFGMTFGLLYFAIRSTHGRIAAATGVLMLISMPATLFWSSVQYADIFMMFFMTASMTLYHLYRSDRRSRSDVITLLGLTLGLGAWTKNEGWALLIAFFAGGLAQLLIGRDRSDLSKQTHRLLWGLLPTLVVPVLFKIIFSPDNNLVAIISNAAIMECILDPARIHLIISQGLLLAFDIKNWWLAPIFCVALLMVSVKQLPSRWKDRELPVIVICFVLVAYTLSYILTPYDLAWALRFSQDRLLLQLSPSIVLLVTTFSFPEMNPRHQ